MATVVVKSIGTGGDYSTLQAWEDAAPADLVAADQIWQGQLKNQTFAHAGAGSLLSMEGSTSDAGHYKELRCEPGASFTDHANKLTNALRADAANGALITASDIKYGAALLSGGAFDRFTGLQIKATSAETYLTVAGANVSGCIVESATANANPSSVSSAENSVFVLNRSGSTGGIIGLSGNAAFLNCTFVVPSNFTAASQALRFVYTGTRTAVNCAFFGCTNVTGLTAGFTATNCYTSSAQSLAGVTQVAYDTSTGSGFENTASSTLDLRLKSTSALVNTGTATGAPTTDIVGTTRPQGAAYDVGAWEYGEAGAPAVTQVTADASGSYAIAGSIQADNAAQYKIASAVTFDAAASYAVRGNAAADASAAYAVSSATQADATAQYAIRAAVTQDASASYSLISNTTVTADAAGAYAVAGAVQTDAEASYAVRAAVFADAVASYALITDGQVTADAAAQYLIRGAVQSDASLAYEIAGAVQASVSAGYAVAGMASADAGASYAVQGALVAVWADATASYFVDGVVVDPVVLPPNESAYYQRVAAAILAGKVSGPHDALFLRLARRRSNGY